MTTTPQWSKMYLKNEQAISTWLRAYMVRATLNHPQPLEGRLYPSLIPLWLLGDQSAELLQERYYYSFWCPSFGLPLLLIISVRGRQRWTSKSSCWYRVKSSSNSIWRGRPVTAAINAWLCLIGLEVMAHSNWGHTSKMVCNALSYSNDIEF